jgi:hypothetical protein
MSLHHVLHNKGRWNAPLSPTPHERYNFRFTSFLALDTISLVDVRYESQQLAYLVKSGVGL